ncbi:MAG: 30S ribosomal protein S20 [Chlamydiia bacterium]|nr:30S ribosomal protein S20 [Chlamydiia bacterium]
MAKKEEKKTKRPTAEKRLIQAEKRREINKAFKTRMRTAARKFKAAITGGDTSIISAALSEAYSLLDKGVKRGLIKLNKASRDKARMAAKAASGKAA